MSLRPPTRCPSLGLVRGSCRRASPRPGVHVVVTSPALRWASPKSMRWGRPCSSIMTFEGLMSRWMTPAVGVLKGLGDPGDEAGGLTGPGAPRRKSARVMPQTKSPTR